jgi:hypothetical protein
LDRAPALGEGKMLPIAKSLAYNLYKLQYAANFSSPVCSPTGDAGNNAETGFMRCFPNCHYSKQWVAKDKILIYIVKGICTKS